MDIKVHKLWSLMNYYTPFDFFQPLKTKISWWYGSRASMLAQQM
jgi:hypothetical protein